MHLNTLGIRRIGVAAVAVLAAAIGASAPALADGSTGSMSGQFVNADGAPLTDCSVTVIDAETWNSVGYAATDDNGDYTISDIPPGNYLVQFQFATLTMYSGDTANSGDAATERVIAGANTVVNEHALPTGTLTGTLTDASGDPIPDASVNAFSGTFGGGYAPTDDTGMWSIEVFAASDYQVSSYLPNGLTEYAPGAGGDQEAASLYAVGPDQTVTVDDRAPATGTVSGTFTDTDGSPVADEYVYVNYLDNFSGAFSSTDSEGHYSVPVFAGTYQVAFYDADYRVQYAYGALTPDQATPITVTGGADSVVDDVKVGTGTITVTAINGTTGKPILNFCAYSDQRNACTTTGTAVLTDVQAGAEEVDITPTAIKYLWTTGGVTVNVVSGQNVDVSQTLQAGESVKTTIVDSVTGAPVAGACVLSLVPGFTMWPDGGERCSNKKGVVTIGPLEPGASYSLFVNAPHGSSYGDQWVGKDGHGTGMEQNALVIPAKANHTVTIANIRLDQGGSISGTVTDAVTGLPIKSAGVGRNTFTPGSGASGDIVPTDANGQYTLSNLGPYQWPIFTNALNHAPMWSGGVGNRYQATPVQVTSGGTTTYNVAMTAGVTLQGTALLADGSAIAEGGYIVVLNAKTGDPMGFTWANPDGTFSVPIMGKQNVRIIYWFQVGSTPYNGNYGGGTGTVVHIPAGGKTVHVVLIPGNNN